MTLKSKYSKPTVVRIDLDNSISLVMMSAPPNPDPRGGGSKGDSDSFKSPFDDKPFS